MVTAARIVTSDAVLGQARTMVDPELSRERVAELVTADSPSQDMLHIVATRIDGESRRSRWRGPSPTSELAYEESASSSISQAEKSASTNGCRGWRTS